MPPEVDPPVEDPKVPPVEPEPEVNPELLPDDVLPPDEGVPAEPDPTPEPSADDLRSQLAAKDAEIAALKASPAAEPAAPTSRVTMAQVFVNQVIPKARTAYAAEKDPARQFEIMAETANQMVGAVMADQVTPAIQQLAAVNIELTNEIEIRDLRSDPDFKAVEKDVRERLKKTDWKLRANPEAVSAIFYALRGAKKNGTVKPVAAAPSAARAALKDLSAGGGASPKPAGVRLTAEQEKDFQGLVENGWPGDRKDYYAKYRARADQAKAQGKKIPATYRG